MKKLIGFNLILSAGLLAVIILPAKVSAQQNLLLNNPVVTTPLNLNNSRGIIHLNAPSVLKQGNQITGLMDQPNGAVVLDKPNNFNQGIITLKGKQIIWTDSVKYAALDHMPIATPNMSLYHMPTLSGAALDHPNPK
jgi:hypothetical protein